MGLYDSNVCRYIKLLIHLHFDESLKSNSHSMIFHSKEKGHILLNLKPYPVDKGLLREMCHLLMLERACHYSANKYNLVIFCK